MNAPAMPARDDEMAAGLSEEIKARYRMLPRRRSSPPLPRNACTASSARRRPSGCSRASASTRAWPATSPRAIPSSPTRSGSIPSACTSAVKVSNLIRCDHHGNVVEAITRSTRPPSPSIRVCTRPAPMRWLPRIRTAPTGAHGPPWGVRSTHSRRTCAPSTTTTPSTTISAAWWWNWTKASASPTRSARTRPRSCRTTAC